MARAWWIVLLGMLAGSASADEPRGPRLAGRFAEIRGEYDAQLDRTRQTQEQAKTIRESQEIYRKMAPDTVAFARRMIDLALTDVTDPGARDALLWVLDFPGRSGAGAYGDEFGRASALLVRHHGDDPEAVRIGLGLDNVATPQRDILLTGFLASAKDREAKGLARLAMAQYLRAGASKFDRFAAGSCF